MAYGKYRKKNYVRSPRIRRVTRGIVRKAVRSAKRRANRVGRRMAGKMSYRRTSYRRRRYY